MGFASDSGYTPASIVQILKAIMTNINTQFGTSYTYDTFVGTNLYKFFYSLAQRLQENEVKTSEIFLNLQQYIRLTNQAISRPVVTNPGLISALETAGFVASVKPANDSDAGKIFVCLDKAVDSGNWEDSAGYAVDKLAAATILKNSTVAGAVTQGTEVSSITLTNGQSFDFKYNLPNRITVDLRLTIALSENNQVVVATADDIKLSLLRNVMARYQLGKDFEPMRYFSVVDAPWAASTLLEWSSDGGSTYVGDVNTAAYDDLFMIDLSRIHLVET